MFFPLYDENPLNDGVPWATWSLIAVNALVFFLAEPFNDKALQAVLQEYALVPAQFVSAPLAFGNLLDLVRSLFLHGSFDHLAGNMFFLFLFGDNIEDTLGVPHFLALYFLTGLCTELTHVVLHASSQAPLIGASGAISGVLGAYLVLFPNIQVRCLVAFFGLAYLTKPPIWIYLSFWFLGQVGNAWLYGDSVGIAFAVHISGFLLGFISTFLIARRWGNIAPFGVDAELRRIENSEEHSVLRLAGPAKHESGLRMIGIPRNSGKKPQPR